MKTDNGGAPCVYRDLLTLAICKPRIRKSAGVGDFVVGIGGATLGDRLIYVARVTGKLINGLYYRATCFADRPDCIYEDLGGTAKLRAGARFHATGKSRLQKDVGTKFQNAHVLLSDDFRYFGFGGGTGYRSYPALNGMLTKLAQGHRRFHDPAVYRDLDKLRKQLWKDFPPGEHGEPSHRNTNQPLNADTPSGQCCSM
jgi:Nucleotide modification associated domain 2